MTRSCCGLVVAISALLLAAASTAALASWPHDPNIGNVLVCGAFNAQFSPTIASDGAGGAIITWYDTRSGSSDIYVQRVNAAGVPQWTADGVALCTAANSQSSPTIVPDGAGGAIVVWHDLRNGVDYDIYAQRVNAAGVPQWTANGVAICTAANTQSYPTIASDGAGGAFVTWYDFRSGSSYDIYAQRVNAAGVPQWTANGVAPCTAAGDQQSPTIASDGAGGAIVTWYDGRGGNYDIYVQRVNAAGVPQWTANGVALCSAASNQYVPVMASDGAGGAIVTWFDLRSGTNYDIYAQRVNAAGVTQWTADGVALCTAANNQSNPTIVSDGSGGAIISWHDTRSGSTSDIYAQRVNPSGVPQWTADGAPVCLAAFDQVFPTITTDLAGGAIITWEDFRGGGNNDIYAQRITAAGVQQWTYNGVALCTAGNYQYRPMIVSDGADGGIVTWYDLRTGFYDIYAQRVERFGYLGSPEPNIVRVRDVPNDQGGKVSVAWSASYLDVAPGNPIDQYWIWRQASSAGVAQANARSEFFDAAVRGALPRPGAIRRSAQGGQIYYWEFVGSQVAHGFPGYSFTVPTLYDSTGAGNPRTLIMVEAEQTYTGSYWGSPPDSGYSVDNLPPAPPTPFVGAYSAGATHLHWGRNFEADLAGYRLYRGSSSGFVPGPGNLVTAQPDTGFGDPGPAGSWYKLSAIDSHGNESVFAILGPDGTTDAPGGPALSALAFSPPAPNPVRGEGASFRIALPVEARVALTLFDQQGRRVREVWRDTVPGGEHFARWDGRDGVGNALASGIYFARLEAMGRTMTVRFVIVR